MIVDISAQFIKFRETFILDKNKELILIHEYLLTEIQSKSMDTICLYCKKKSDQYLCFECLRIIYKPKISDPFAVYIVKKFVNYKTNKSTLIELSNEIDSEVNNVFLDLDSKSMILNVRNVIHQLNIQNLEDAKQKLKNKTKMIVYNELRQKYFQVVDSCDWGNLFILKECLDEMYDEIYIKNSKV